MRPLVAALLSLLAVSPLSGDVTLDCMTRATWGSRGIPSDFEVDGSRVFVADGRGVTLYDASNPTLVRELAVGLTARPSVSLMRTGSRIAVLTSGTLEIFEERGGGLVGIYGTPISAHAMAATASHIATVASDLTIWRVAADGTLEVLGRTRLDSAGLDVAIAGSHLFVAEQETGISVFEIGGGKIASIPLPAKSLAVSNGRLFVASGLYGVSVVDVSNPRFPQILSSGSEGLTDARRISIAGDHVLVDDDGKRLVVMALAGGRLTAAGTIEGGQRVFAGASDRLYLTPFDTSVAFRIVDLAGNRLGEFRQKSGPLSGVALRGDVAYVADPPYFRVLDLRDSRSPREVASIDLADTTDRVRLEGNLALVHGTGNVHLIDIARPLAPKWIGTYRSLGLPRSGAAMAGHILLEANRASGFHVVDISDPAAPRQTSGLRNDGYGQFLGVVAMPGVAYASITSGIKVVDLSNPNNVRYVSVIAAPSLYDLEIAAAASGRAPLLLALDSDLLRIFDLRDPLSPVELSQTQIPRSLDMAVDGEKAYLTSFDGALTIVGFANPARPLIERTLRGLSAPSQVAADGGRIAVADHFSLRLLRDPSLALTQTPITLKVTGQSSARLAHLAWTSVSDAMYELQMSESADFTSTTTVTTGRSDFAFALRNAVTARVRVVDGCDAGAWSNVVRISPDDFGLLAFVAHGSHHVIAGSGTVSIDIAVRNQSETTQTARIATEPKDLLAISEATIAPRTEGFVRVLVDAASLSGTREFALRLNDDRAAPYKLKITSPRAALGENSVASESLIIPAVGSIRGGSGTMWRSDLHIYCRDGDCPMDVRFRRYGDGARARSFSITLAAGEVVVIPDAIASLFAATGESGYLEIASPVTDQIEASAITYNDAPSGKYGERIPAARVSEVAASAPRILLGIAQNERARTNVGFIETSGRTTTANLTLYSREGAILGGQTLTIPAFASFQQPLLSLFPSATGLDGASIAIQTGPGVIAYSSRVDQRSGDSSFSYASTPSSQLTQIDVVGLTPGAEGTFWRSALQIANTSATASTFDLELIAAGEHASERVVVPAHGSFSTEDVITELFARHDPRLTSSATLRIRSSSPFAAWARIYNDHAAGTYGQSIVPRALGSDRRNTIDIFPLSESPTQRSNVGFGETSGRTTTATLRFFDGSGALLGITHRTLAPFETRSLLAILRDAGLERVYPVRLSIESDGDLFAYGSVVERANGDAVFISTP